MRSPRLVSACLLCLVLGGCSGKGPGAVTVRLDPSAGSRASGEVALTSLGHGTSAAITIRGLVPRTTVRALINGGTCARPGASATLVARLTASRVGVAAATAPVRFHGSEDVALSDIADGAHVVRIVRVRELACGQIPRL